MSLEFSRLGVIHVLLKGTSKMFDLLKYIAMIYEKKNKFLKFKINVKFSDSSDFAVIF